MSANERPAASEQDVPMREVAPGVHIAGNARRVLHSGDPRGEDLRAAERRVMEIRSRLSAIRSALEDVGRIEAMFPHDRLCDKVAGSLTLALIALHGLTVGERSLMARANANDELWADASANPAAYKIEDGETWDWRPRAWNVDV